MTGTKPGNLACPPLRAFETGLCEELVQNTRALGSGRDPSRSCRAGMTLAGVAWCGKEQDGGACVGTPSHLLAGEDGGAPLHSSCPGQVNSHASQEEQSWLPACLLRTSRVRGAEGQWTAGPRRWGKQPRLPELVPPLWVEVVMGGEWWNLFPQAHPGSWLPCLLHHRACPLLFPHYNKSRCNDTLETIVLRNYV